jgi:hypothetical protein
LGQKERQERNEEAVEQVGERIIMGKINGEELKDTKGKKGRKSRKEGERTS